MAKKIGDLLKEARTGAGLSQKALAEAVGGLSASDVGKAERGEKELSEDLLKKIAKATGVTQKSLLEAAGRKAKTGSSGQKSGAKSVKKTSSAEGEFKLTAAEKKLVEAYRAADSETRKEALRLLSGEKSDSSDALSSLLGNALGMFAGKK
ncbi:MAG: helix-turn-helix transcriptional regulator [Clostridia bacterium]|nr:helix-turn-helix transcriptional regulator [Clostridia bacterium]